MTTVHISLGRDDGTDQTAAKGVVEWEPTTRREDGTMVILERGFTVPLVDGEATVTVDPSGLTWCWRVTERTDSGGTVRYVSVPDSATTVEYVDLPDVDPTTLVAWSPADPEAAYQAALDAIGGGAGTVTSVDGIEPDESGNVSLSSTYVARGATVLHVALSADHVLDTSAWPTTEVVTVVFTQDGTGGWAVTYGTGVTLATGIAWTVSGVGGDESVAVFRYSPNLSKWVCEGSWVSVGGSAVPTTPTVALTDETINTLTVTQPFTLAGGATSVTVNWGDGGATESDSTSPAAHTYATAGTYNATFTPTDGTTTGSPVGTVYAVTVNYAPSLTLGAETITDLDVSQPFTTSDADDDTVTVTADWDDGTTPAIVTSPATHTYAADGTYNATFTPNDGTTNGAVRTAIYAVSASALPPVGDPATLAQAMIDYGALVYWKLDETTGTVATDYSGNARHGTYVGTPGTDYTLAGQDGIATFLTTAGKVTLPDDDVFNVGTNGITVFILNRISTSSAGRNLIRKGKYADWQVIANAAQIQSGVKDGSTWRTYAVTGNINYAGTWHAFATTIPYPSGGVYPDIFMDNTTATRVASTAGTAGAYPNGTSDLEVAAGMIGAAGHAAVFPVALTTAHIEKLFTLARAEGLIP